MNLAAVLAFCGLQNVEKQISLQEMHIDSRQVKPGDLFVAVPGLNTDGRNYVPQALANGAAAVLVESSYEKSSSSNIPIIQIENLKNKLNNLAAFFYQNPAQDLKLIGITGTNGKTSCSHYIAQILSAANLSCGVMGTIGNGMLSSLKPSLLTTSDSCKIQQQFVELKRANAKYVAMEISSHALDQNRLLGIDFETAIFTNLSQDHLDYHANMQEYFVAKTRLFKDYNIKNCIINIDDPYGVELLKLLAGNTSLKIITYSLTNNTAEVYLENNKIYSPWGVGSFYSPLLGKFNTSNLLACISACALQGVSLEFILNFIKNLHPVPGRMQKVHNTSNEAPLVVVDYAHTPDALSKALQALRAHAKGKIYCIFGCGGDRDRTKRPLMLRAAIEYSDKIVITQDNSRTEDPQQILKDILADQIITSKINVELDRAMAIQKTIAQAGVEDLVLIAGKGHEDYQIIGEHKTPFSDLLVAQQALAFRSENAWIG